MKEAWKVFRDTATGRELMAYTIRGTFEGEEQATKETLAGELGTDPACIVTSIELR